MPREYLAQCWSCLGEFDAGSAVWCTCSARTPTKLCPFCIHCFCQADPDYHEGFWNGAPEELREERAMLRDAPGTVGEALIRSNLLNTDQLLSALKYSQSRGVALEAAVVELGFVSRENLSLVSGQAQGSTAIDLSRQLIDASLVSAVSVELCYRKRLLPISREEIGGNAVLTLAMAGPTEVETIDQIQTLTGCRIISMSAPEREILDRLRDLFPEEVARLASDEAEAPVVAGPHPPREAKTTGVRAPAAPPARDRTAAPGPAPAAPTRPRTRRARPAAAAAAPPAPAARGGAARAAAPSRLEELVPIDEEPDVPGSPDPLPSPRPAAAATAPTPAEAAGVLQKILSEAIGRKASHVQIEIREAQLSLFLRVDGTLFRARPPAACSAAQLARAVASCASLDAGDRQAVGRFTVKAGERRIEVVARRRPFQGGESLFLKIVDPQQFFRSLEDLGPSALDRGRIVKALGLPTGLVALSAPPHNGLDATRYSLLAHLGQEGRRVLSIESPRLIAVERARQEEIPPPPTAAAARAALAAAKGAEVLFLPEIDGAEMAALALEAASESLVVVPVQARRASQTPAALLWHRLDPAALAERLRLVVNQRLVRRLCEGCRVASPVADRVFKMMGLSGDESLDLKVFQASGCERCGPLSPGYQGRLALFEVMDGTPEVAALVASGASPGEIEREARRAGMSPLRAACLAGIGQGITTLEEFQKGNF